MAPPKFVSFKSRSRELAVPPSTQNLDQRRSTEIVATSSPVRSLNLADESSKMKTLKIDGGENEPSSPRQASISSSDGNYAHIINIRRLFHRQRRSISSDDTASMRSEQSTLSQPSTSGSTLKIDEDNASTIYDALSLQFDESFSISPSVRSVRCGGTKKAKKMRSKARQQIRDLDMWRASNLVVMENLLNRSRNHDEQIKWEAIATARGLCTLTTNCTCNDCVRSKYLASITDGDAGLGAAPLWTAINVGCIIQ